MTDQELAISKPDPKSAIVLAPVTQIAGRLSPLHVLKYTRVPFDRNEETYPISGDGGGGRAPLKALLMRIAVAAGISVVSSDPLYPPTRDSLFWQVKIAMDVGSATPAEFIGTAEWSADEELVDKYGKPLDEKQTKTINRIRKYRTRMTESKALLAAIRQALAMKAKYNDTELALGSFIVPKIVYEPDLSDANVRSVVVAQGSAAQAALYGAGGEQPDAPMLEGAVDPYGGDPDEPMDPDEFIDVEPEDEDMDPGVTVSQPDPGAWVMDNEQSTFNGRTLHSIEAEKPGYVEWMWKNGRGDENMRAAFFRYLEAYHPEVLEGGE